MTVLAINEEFRSLDSAVPKAASVLSDLGEVPVFHEDHGFRHPFGAYNISLAAIGKRACRVIEEVHKLRENRRPSGRGPEGEALLEATDHLLDAMMEHLDVCHAITSGFFAPADERGRKIAYGKLKKEIEPYRRHIGAVDNYIKHKQGTLRLIEFSWPSDRCFGYFVEGPVDKGVVGPAKEIHTGSNSAFSFNRDVRFHLCAIFAIGARLASVLHSIDKRLLPVPNRVVETRDNEWKRALQLAADLPRTFFPDEVAKPVPDIRLANERLIVSAPATRVRAVGPPYGAQVSLVYAGDGVTRSFKAPYYREA